MTDDLRRKIYHLGNLAHQGSWHTLEDIEAQEVLDKLVHLHEAVEASLDEIAARERDCGSPPVIAERLRSLL